MINKLIKKELKFLNKRLFEYGISKPKKSVNGIVYTNVSRYCIALWNSSLINVL